MSSGTSSTTSNPISVSKEYYVQFDGKQENWLGYKARLEATAEKKGWKETLTSYISGDDASETQNKNAKEYFRFSLHRDAFIFFQNLQTRKGCLERVM